MYNRFKTKGLKVSSHLILCKDIIKRFILTIDLKSVTPIPSVELCCPQVSITLTKLLFHPWNHYPLFMPREVLCDVMMEGTMLAWEPNESQCHSPGRGEK